MTELFERNKIEDAIAKTLRDYSGGSTDYGQAFADFRKLCMDDVDNRTTIVILGDARNNYGDPRTDILKEMYDRSKRVIWLNPEPRSTPGPRGRFGNEASTQAYVSPGRRVQLAHASRTAWWATC